MTAKQKKARIVLFLIICYIGYGIYYPLTHMQEMLIMIYGGIFLIFPLLPIVFYIFLGIILFERLETYSKPD